MTSMESRVDNESSSSSSLSPPTKESQAARLPVYLNIYDLNFGTPGFRAYHTDIGCGDREYAFYSGAGILHYKPANASTGVFKERIQIGEVESIKEVNDVAYSLRKVFPMESYNIVFHNCNDFTNRLSKELFGKEIPRCITRLARVARSKAGSVFLPLCLDRESRRLILPTGNKLKGV